MLILLKILPNKFIIMDKEDVFGCLKSVIDPEIKRNIVDLGLVYDVKFSDKEIVVFMTLTSPACPVGGFIVDNVKSAVKESFKDFFVQVNLVWDPPWSTDMIADHIKLELGL